MDNMSLADIAAVTNKDNDGFFGGDGFCPILAHSQEKKSKKIRFFY